MNSHEIQIELTKLETRHQELQQEAAEALQSLENAKEGHLLGTHTTSDVTSAHSTHSALQNTLDTLSGRIEATRTELESQLKKEGYAADLSRFRALAGNANRESDELITVFQSSAQVVASALEVVFAQYDKFEAERREFANAVNGYTGGHLRHGQKVEFIGELLGDIAKDGTSLDALQELLPTGEPFNPFKPKRYGLPAFGDGAGSALLFRLLVNGLEERHSAAAKQVEAQQRQQERETRRAA